MNYSVKEVKQFVEGNDVKFVKLAFCDVFGRQKNVSIVAGELDEVFSSGFVIDASAVYGGAAGGRKVVLFPEPNTLCVLPWRPQSGRVVSMLCRVTEAGEPSPLDVRTVLSGAVGALAARGMTCRIGTSCAFYVLMADENGNPSLTPYDRAEFCDAAPVDRCENIRRDIVLSLETMGIKPTSSNHERGKGQNRIVFKSSDPMKAADNLLQYKATVRNVCVRDGAYATFMPLPFPGDADSGLVLTVEPGCADEEAFLDFVAGVKARLPEFAAVAVPTANGYERLIGESFASRGEFITADVTSRRLTVSLADNTCNPYLVFALIIYAGLSGRTAGKKKLPADLGEATAALKSSAFAKKYLPAEIFDIYAAGGKGPQTDIPERR